jgi:hypothetical protein
MRTLRDIVAYRHVSPPFLTAKRETGQQPLLGSRFLTNNKTKTIEELLETVFYTRSVQGVIRRTTEARMQNCKGVCDEKTFSVQLAQKLKNLHC